jgi:hypothetical protein
MNWLDNNVEILFMALTRARVRGTLRRKEQNKQPPPG